MLKQWLIKKSCYGLSDSEVISFDMLEYVDLPAVYTQCCLPVSKTDLITV
jgi:hypothetical protein